MKATQTILFLLILIFYACISFSKNNVKNSKEYYNSGIKIDSTLINKANKGDKQAQYDLGLYYHKRLDYEAAYEWFEKAAKQKHPASLGMLGIYSMGGKGYVYDSIKAENLFFNATMLGDSTSVSYLASIY